MNNKLDSYVKIYNLLDIDKCKETVEELDHLEFELHRYYNNVSKSYESYDKELSVYFGHSIHKLYFMNMIRSGIEKYLQDLKFSWFTSWSGYSNIRYNKYSSETQMKLHCDHIHTLFDGNVRGIPILSIVGCLNDNYIGGEFIMFDDTEIELKTGDVLIFPSNFLYPHCVKEIAEGTRYSFVSWVY